LRTARGAGRWALLGRDGVRPADFAAGRLVVAGEDVLRDRVLELLFFVLLVLRDPGGEDVRVAMFRP